MCNHNQRAEDNLVVEESMVAPAPKVALHHMVLQFHPKPVATSKRTRKTEAPIGKRTKAVRITFTPNHFSTKQVPATGSKGP